MNRDGSFSELFERVCRGDAEAAEIVVRRYESAIRVAVRTRLSDPMLRRQFDSIDVCQSVLSSFFIRAATGAFDLHAPKQLVALLVKMAQNKLAMRARSQYRQRRDIRRAREIAGNPEELVSPAPGPLRQAVGKEMLDRALGMMSTEIRGIAEQRMRGEPWSAIASELGGTPDSRRKQYEREVAYIADALDMSAVAS